MNAHANNKLQWGQWGCTKAECLTRRAAIAARIVNYIQEQVSEAVVIAALVKGIADCTNLLGSWCNACCKLCGVERLLLLSLHSTKETRLLLILLLWLLRRTKQAELLLVLLLRLL